MYGDSNWKDKLTSFDGHAITYDDIGNPLNDGTWTYEWQAGRQLRSMTKTEDGATITMEFTYNHAGLRTKKVKKVNGGIEETTNYIWNGKQVVGLTKGDDTMHFYYDAQGRVSTVNYNCDMYTYVHNLQGDVIGIVDENGALVVEYRYNVWGEMLFNDTNNLASLNPFRYREYIFDSETKTYYLLGRYYSQPSSRFINSDVIISKKVYVYTGNDPVQISDYNGMSETVSVH